MAIEAGTSTYYQAKRGIPRDNLVFYIDPTIKDSYRNIGDDKIYSLVNPSHYMNINSGNSFKRGRKNSGIEYTGGNTNGTMWATTINNYGMNMATCTYILYARCNRGYNGVYGSFNDWIFQLGSYYSNSSLGFGLYGWSFYLFAKGSYGGGWSWSSSSSSATTLYSNSLDQWVFYVVRFTSTTTCQVYMNNALYYNATGLSVPFGSIGSNLLILGRNLKQTVGLFAVYDTALSDDKISDFYNATRHRFGV